MTYYTNKEKLNALYNIPDVLKIDEYNKLIVYKLKKLSKYKTNNFISIPNYIYQYILDLKFDLIIMYNDEFYNTSNSPSTKNSKKEYTNTYYGNVSFVPETYSLISIYFDSCTIFPKTVTAKEFNMNNLNELAKSIFNANKEKGFWDERGAILDPNSEFKLSFKIPTGKNIPKSNFIKKALISQLLMLVTTELAEAEEANRKDLVHNKEQFDIRVGELTESLNPTLFPLDSEERQHQEDRIFKKAFESNIKNSFNDEVTDAIIRLFDMCGGLNIDLNWHMEQKLRYNSLREFKHGKSH